MSEPIFDHALDDGMQAAMEHARGTFGYFWRELHWEYRRIVPALSTAAVKAAFSDPEDPDTVEQMWIDHIHFDGHSLFGTLLNQPRSLQGVAQGDLVQLPLERVSDWMLCIADVVYGGFTVQHLRRGMEPAERASHDAAWGLAFGDPAQVLLPHPDEEHPMSENMGPSLAEHLAANPGSVNEPDEQGWTFLHHFALGGSLAGVEVLLEHGADTGLKTAQGDSARDLALRLGWERIADLLAP